MNLSNDTGWPRHVLKAAEGIWSRLHTTGREPRRFDQLDIDTLDDLCIQAGLALHGAESTPLAYLLGQYDRLLAVLEKVCMDTPEDQARHRQVVEIFRMTAEPIRRSLSSKEKQS